jgi:hypothetical protein
MGVLEHVLCHDGTMKIGVHLFRDTNDIIDKLPILSIIHDECHRGEGCQDGNIAGRPEQGLALTSFDGVSYYLLTFVASTYV